MDELDDEIAKVEKELADAKRVLEKAKREASPEKEKLLEKLAEARHYADTLEAQLGELAVDVQRHKELEEGLVEELAMVTGEPPE